MDYMRINGPQERAGKGKAREPPEFSDKPCLRARLLL